MLRDVLQSINSGLLVELLGSSSFLPSSLFASGEEGVWYDPSDISVLFQDNTGATPVTAPGQTIGLVLDKSSNGFNATQATTAARPSYIVDADGVFIQHDPVDDALTVTLPDLGTEATVAYVTRSEVRLLEDQTISGSYTLPAQELANFVVIDRALTFAEKVNLIRYLASKVEGVNYGAEIDRLTLIAINAVDVFVYDTTKDSDGGAWRNGALAQASSWYNETLNTATRGSRRDFPAVAVIVAEAAKVTIYDGDDPALPMWDVPLSGSSNVSSVFAMNGKIHIGRSSSGADKLLDYVADTVYQPYSNASFNGYLPFDIASATVDLVGTIGQTNPNVIVGASTNDVAMTVLPDAPIDPATGLPVPTIAVATDGGVSVIKDDGTVVDITASSYTLYAYSVQFDENDLVFQADSNPNATIRRITYVQAIPEADFVLTGNDYNRGNADERYIPVIGGAWIGDLFFTLGGSNSNQALSFNGSIATEGSLGLNLISRQPDSPTNGLIAGISSDYNTGWMNGNIKGAFLSDTDDTDLVGSGELVTNGTFDTDTSGWEVSPLSDDALSAVSGRLRITSGPDNTATFGGARQLLTLTAGKRYTVTIGHRYKGTNGAVGVGVFADGSRTNSLGLVYGFADASNEQFDFTASTTNYLFVWGGYGTAGTYVEADNISVKLADADRSVNNKGLIVHGTITRSPVATGAELVAYSGFSTSNYLEQPYNSALDFGTGDFCVMGWVKPVSAAADYVFDCRQSSVSPTGFFVYINESSQPTFYTQQAGSTTFAASSVAISLGVWQQVVGVRKSGVNYIYLNGVLVGSTSGATQNVNDTNRKLIVGNSVGLFSYHALQSSLALLRISATVPTADQIAKIYADEKVLFQENAACTLYGASDAVTALAHDPGTDLLHVGTSAGRSVFDGLRRVGNTTTSVSVAISATGGLIVEK